MYGIVLLLTNIDAHVWEKRKGQISAHGKTISTGWREGEAREAKNVSAKKCLTTKICGSFVLTIELGLELVEWTELTGPCYQ